MAIPKMKFDGTINAGHIATVVAIIAATSTAWSNLNSNQTRLDSRVSTIESDRRDVQRYREMIVSSNARLAALENLQAQNTVTSTKISEQLTGIREDIAGLKVEVRKDN